MTYGLIRCPSWNVALRIVSRPTPVTISARISSGHSMCASSRRSILSNAHPSPLFREAEVGLEHFLGDGRRNRAAAAVGVLHQRRDGNRRLLRWSEGDEPGVVALVPLHLVRLQPGATDGHHLRGTGLTADGDVGKLGVLAGTVR